VVRDHVVQLAGDAGALLDGGLVAEGLGGGEPGRVTLGTPERTVTSVRRGQDGSAA
jgi:hypothetical protein